MHIVENMFADNYKKNHKEHAAGEYPIVRGRGLGAKRTPGILIRVKHPKEIKTVTKIIPKNTLKNTLKT